MPNTPSKSSSTLLISFCSFSDQLLLLFWSNFSPFLINSWSILLTQLPWRCSFTCEAFHSFLCVLQRCSFTCPVVLHRFLFVLLPQFLLVLQRSSVPPEVFVCFATFNISLLSSLVARTSRWKLKVVHQPSFLFLEKILVLCYLERKLVTQYLVYNLPKDLSEFCSLAKNNGRWCLRSERSWETGGNGRWPTWGRNAMQAVALHWPQRGAHPPNITYCPTILRQNIKKKTIYWKILPLSGLNVVPMHPPKHHPFSSCCQISTTMWWIFVVGYWIFFDILFSEIPFSPLGIIMISEANIFALFARDAKRILEWLLDVLLSVCNNVSSSFQLAFVKVLDFCVSFKWYWNQGKVEEKYT